jgi:hypothetical protein
MLTVACRVGRLLELRLAGNPSVEDADQFERDAHSNISRIVRETKKPIVVCSDLRASHLFKPEVSEKLIHTMKGASPNLERNGILGNNSALLFLQLARFVKETTQDSRRRVFTDVEPMLSWLDEVLTPAERARMRQFLNELDTALLLATAPGKPGATAGPPPTAAPAPTRPTRSRGR